MLMPVIIIGGMKSGVFTPTEAAVVAAFYALVVALFVHREMRIPEIGGVLVRAAKTTAIVMFLCAGAQVASYMITLADLPSVLTSWLGPLVESPRLLMAVMMIVLVLIGTALDLTPTILIFGPVMLPIAVKAATAQKPVSAPRNRGEGKVEVTAGSGNERTDPLYRRSGEPGWRGNELARAGRRETGLAPR